MGVFNHFPYTNIHDLNLDWVLAKLKEQDSKIVNFINLNTIKYADPIAWNITSQYEANTVVIDPQTGNAYLSTKPVPAGVLISNANYWTPIFNYQEEIDRLENEINSLEEKSVPTGGSAGQILSKNSNANFDMEWTTPQGGIEGHTILAGVARYDTATGSWLLLNNEGHAPLNITGISGNTPYSFRITYNECAKVNSLVCTPDETFARAGVFCGASVGTSYSDVYLAQHFSGNIKIQIDSNENITITNQLDVTVPGFTGEVLTSGSLGKYIKVGNDVGLAMGANINYNFYGTKERAYVLGLAGEGGPVSPGYFNFQLLNADDTALTSYANKIIYVYIDGLSPTICQYGADFAHSNIWIFGIMQTE